MINLSNDAIIRHDHNPFLGVTGSSQGFVAQWNGSALVRESTLHQLSPYIGKMKSSMAAALISAFTEKGQTIYDPFCGSGTIALESWGSGRKVLANDLSPYAFVLTSAKLLPCLSIEDAMLALHSAELHVNKIIGTIDLRQVPKWVRGFYNPETLREAIAWCRVLQGRKSYFLLSCLLGILHHQRPGFLSFPSSHTVPYLREKKFPRHQYPTLYEYRPVRERLEKKVHRALKRAGPFDPNIERACYKRAADRFVPDQSVDAILTSPPYMRQLDYGRDNRLRLWFLGSADWKALDRSISPDEARFIGTMKRCLKLWRQVLRPSGKCILVLGDTYSRRYRMQLPDLITRLACEEVGGYALTWKHTESIPNNRRVRRGYMGSRSETVLVLQNRG
jgi:SAM-dependent methyltransferase